MELLQVYKSENGTIIAKLPRFMIIKGVTEKMIRLMIEDVLKENQDVDECTIKSDGKSFASAWSNANDFLGNFGIHINDFKCLSKHNNWYLYQVGTDLHNDISEDNKAFTKARIAAVRSLNDE